MARLLTPKYGSWLGLLLLLGAATAALAQQFGGGGQAVKATDAVPPVLEFTQQEIQPPLLVQTLNDLSKQHWEIFQIIPAWTVKNDNGESALVPKSYEIFARRPVAQK